MESNNKSCGLIIVWAVKQGYFVFFAARNLRYAAAKSYSVAYTLNKLVLHVLHYSFINRCVIRMDHIFFPNIAYINIFALYIYCDSLP